MACAASHERASDGIDGWLRWNIFKAPQIATNRLRDPQDPAKYIPLEDPGPWRFLKWQKKADRKRNEAANKIPQAWRLPAQILDTINQDSTQSVINVPRTCGLLTKQELLITEDYDATDILELLASSRVTSVAVTTAFSKRAAIAQQLTHCLTETFFDQALERAKQLDDYLAESGKPLGPLHGLPISVKDSFNIDGIPSTIGFVSFIDNAPPTQNSAVIDILLGAGAVLYVKTNIPQTMMTPDSHNNTFGRVLNPHKLSLTAGGSSGGEAALMAMRGAPLGIATDIAGSVRIPALCCGTFGFRPSVGRIPYGGQCSGGRKGMVGFGPSAGPLSHSVRDAKLLLNVMFDANGPDLDPMALSVSWREPKEMTKLTIGLMPEDPRFPLHPPMQRAMEQAVRKLETAGHTIIDISNNIPSISKASKVAFRYFGMDPARTAFTHIERSGEPEIPSLEVSYPRKGTVPEPTLDEVFKLNVKRAEVAYARWNVFVRNRLDFILSPGYQSCSQPHDTYGEPAYTVYPACVIPFSRAEKEADARYVRNVQYIPDCKSPYVTPLVGGAIAAFGNQVITTTLIAYAVDCHRDRAMDIGVLVNFIRQVWGFVGPFYMPLMFESLGFSGSAGLMVGIVVLFALLPILGLHWFASKTAQVEQDV